MDNEVSVVYLASGEAINVKVGARELALRIAKTVDDPGYCRAKTMDDREIYLLSAQVAAVMQFSASGSTPAA
jgi:hypothetical protein